MGKGFLDQLSSGLGKMGDGVKKLSDSLSDHLNENSHSSQRASGTSNGRNVTPTPTTPVQPVAQKANWTAPKTFNSSSPGPVNTNNRTASTLPGYKGPASSQFQQNGGLKPQPNPQLGAMRPSPVLAQSYAQQPSFPPQPRYQPPAFPQQQPPAQPPSYASATGSGSTPAAQKVNGVQSSSNSVSQLTSKFHNAPSAPQQPSKPFSAKPLPRPGGPGVPNSSPQAYSRNIAPAASNAPNSFQSSAKPIVIQAPAPVAPFATKTIEKEPVANAGQFIWDLIGGDRSKIVSLDIKPVSDANGNPIIRGYQYQPGYPVNGVVDLVWNIKYRDALGVQKETQFFSKMYGTQSLPLDVRSAEAKSVFWKTYLSMHGYIETFQGCLNPFKRNPDIWAVAEKFVKNGVVRPYSHTIPVGSKTFTLPVDFGDLDSKFNLQIINATPPTFTIINDVVAVPAPVKAKSVIKPLTPNELACLTSHPLYPANSLGILEPKWKVNGERDYLGEVEAIYDYLKSFQASLGARESKGWTKFCDRISWMNRDIQRWKQSGLPLPIDEHGKLKLGFGYIGIDKYILPEEQRNLLDSHLTIKQYEFEYILLRNAQGPRMAKYVKEWKSKQGDTIGHLVTAIRDGQMNGSVDNAVMALLQRRIPELKDYIVIYNKTLESRGTHFSWDLQTYNPGIHAAEMSTWKSRQNQSTGGMVYRSQMMDSYNPAYGSAVRTATTIQQVAEYSPFGGHSGGGYVSGSAQKQLIHPAWILKEDGTRAFV